MQTNSLIVYISAAGDLRFERDALARAIAEIPADLSWQIVQSPLAGETRRDVDRNMIIFANIHILLLGGDIRAPIGQEFALARQQAGRYPICLYKRSAARTPAAQNFYTYIANQTEWRPFADLIDLRKQVLWMLADYILEHASQLGLQPVEYETIAAWQQTVGNTDESTPEKDGKRSHSAEAGQDGIILSQKQIMQAGGIPLKNRPTDSTHQ